jgi:hypothetical protein
MEGVEQLIGQQLGLAQAEVRRLVWRNLAKIVRETGTQGLLPEPLVATLTEVGSG